MRGRSTPALAGAPLPPLREHRSVVGAGTGGAGWSGHAAYSGGMAQGDDEHPVVHVVTTAAERPDLDVHARTKRYLITMGIRTACFLLAIVTPGWWRWGFVLAAAGLPYIAVVLANARRPSIPGQVEDPTIPPERRIGS